MAKKHPYDLPPDLLKAAASIANDPVVRELARQAKSYESEFRRLSDLTHSAGLAFDTAAVEAARAGFEMDRGILEAAASLKELSRAALGPIAQLQVGDVGGVDLSQLGSELLGRDIDSWRATLSSSLELSEAIARSLDFSRFTGVTLSTLNPSALGGAFAIDYTFNQALASSLTEVTSTFASLYEDLDAEGALSTLPRYAIDRPPRELFVHSGLLDAISIRAPERASALAFDEEYRALASDTEADLQSRLAALDVALLEMWQGAHYALRSRGADRLRHASVSLRELVTQVLHLLAPDKDVADWAPGAEHFDSKKRPTRQTRLLYVARHLNRDRFSRFVNADVAAALELVDLLHKGVHTPESGFTEEQLRLLALRVGHLLLFLMEMAEHDGD